MTTDIITLEIKLLLLKYGRDSVLRALAQADEIPINELSALIAQKKPKAKSQGRKRNLKPEEFVESRQGLDSERKTLLLALARRYTNRTFLPTWSQIEEFVHQHTGENFRASNRQRAWPAIYRVLSELSLNELSSVEKESANREDKSDYEVLAGGILRAD
jgi:hypothetical protein